MPPLWQDFSCQAQKDRQTNGGEIKRRDRLGGL